MSLSSTVVISSSVISASSEGLDSEKSQQVEKSAEHNDIELIAVMKEIRHFLTKNTENGEKLFTFPENRGIIKEGIVEKYDPDQPRDENGRWTSGGGGTVAVTPDGDIISVCGKVGDSVRGGELLQMAVENGGTKLDAFSGLYGFYRKCGFEPVSWCKFSKEYAPPGWTEGRDEEEPVIFWKYTGNKASRSDNLKAEMKGFLQSTKGYSGETGYDDAMKDRDAAL